MMVKPIAKEHIYTEAVVERLFAVVEEAVERVALILMIFGGMRVGEVAHCDRSWWDKTAINIPKAKPCGCYDCRTDKRHPGTWTPKTKDAARRIPIPPEFRPVITTFFRKYPEIGISRISLWRRIKALARRGNIDDNVFPHAFRATYITRMLEKGVPDWIVRQVVGHKNVATTSMYVRLSKRTIDEGLAKAWD